MHRQADARSKAPIEPGVNGALDAIAQLHKDWDHRFTFNRPDLLKRYLDGRIDVYLAMRVRRSSQIDPVGLYAVLDSPGEASSGGWGQFDPKIGLGVHRNAATHEQSVSDHDQQPVFVCNVEVMDNLQNRIGRISRPVWLHSLDDGPVRSGDALYYSVFDGLFKFLRSTTDGKDDPLVRRYSVLAGQRPNGVIKTRPELMNNLSSNDRNSQRDWRPQDFEGVSATFRLTLSDDRISAAVQESGDLVIEITDLLFGPLNLGPAPVEGV